MLGSRARQRLLSVAVLITLAAAPVVSYGQNTGGCPQTGQCGGTCSIGGVQGMCYTGESACWCALTPPFTLTLTPFSPGTVNRGQQATSTVTITPSGSGAVGSVTLSTLACPSPVICTFNPLTVPSAPGTAQLTVTVPATFQGTQVTITVTGTDTGAGVGPSNGPQSITLNIAGLSMVSVVTQRYNPQRTGANLQEHILNVAAVSSPDFQKLFTIPTAGQVYAQPLLVPQVPFPDGTFKNVLVVATMLDTVQAFQVDDALHPTFAPIPLWSTVIGTPLPANFMPMENTWCSLWVFNICVNLGDSLPPFALALPPIPSTANFIVNNLFFPPGSGALGLYNINPSIGIVSTPVIDPASLAIFVVGKVWAGSLPTVRNILVKIDLVTGNILGSSTVIGANASIPNSGAGDAVNGVLSFEQTHHMQRPALLLQNFGELYVGFGSHQDTKPWHGWIFGFDSRTLAQNLFWSSTPNAEGGSIWQAGNGIAGDGSNVYVMTGNGCHEDDCKSGNNDVNAFNPQLFNFADSFVELDRGLNVIGSFQPSDEGHREGEDLDVGSSGPVLLPGTSILIGIEKESLMFVLDTSTNLGMRQIFQAGQAADNLSFSGSGYHHNHGDPVVWRSSDQGMTVYFWPERDYLRAFRWDDAKAVFDCAADPNGCEIGHGNTTTPDQQSTFPSPTCPGCMPGGILSISAEGDTPGSGVLWASLPFNTQGSTPNSAVGGGLNNVVPGVLHAFNAEDITQDLWNSEANSSRDGSLMFAKFNPPIVANGRVYLATFGTTDSPQTLTGSINVYGMRQWAKFMSQSYPSTPISAVTTFNAQVTFLNAGTTTWTPGAFALVLQPVSRAPQGTPTSIPLPAAIAPGSQVTFAMNLPASGTAGIYQYVWQMQQLNVESFGDLTPPGLVQVGGTLDEQQRLLGSNVEITITDSATKQPVSGVTVVINEDSGKVSLTTSSQGTVSTLQPRCYKGSTSGGVKPFPIYGSCDASASKQPDYGEIFFFVPSQ
jgi:hypothetical protein